MIAKAELPRHFEGIRASGHKQASRLYFNTAFVFMISILRVLAVYFC